MPVNYSLRPTTQSDYEFLYKLKKLCLKEYVAETWGWNEEVQRAYFAESFDPNDSQIITLNDQDIGQLLLEDRGVDLYLAGIYILPTFQGKGIGTAVLQDILLAAQDRRLPVRLQVLKVNPARKLYERLGFKLTGETETHYLMGYQDHN